MNRTQIIERLKLGRNVEAELHKDYLGVRTFIEVAADPTMSNIRLGEMLGDEFPELDSLAIQLVWHWMGPGKTQGLNDASLDASLLPIFRDSGYSVRNWNK